jgi:tRNA pseudouridine38-40 synthase
MALAVLDREKELTLEGMAIPSLALHIALIVEYDGSRYAGSQFQKHLPTIQSELEAALYKLSGEKIRVSLASRTDAGVHARGQVVSFSTSSNLPMNAYIHGLNHHLPADIAVRTACIVTCDFDPRRHAIKREYDYYIINSINRSPLWQGRAYQVPSDLDIISMNQACQVILGEHDFTSFTSNLDIMKSAVRNVYQAEVIRDGDLVIFKIMANAFLPHQVRYIVGTLLRVGQKRLSTEGFNSILRARQPALAGPVAPACGLYLNRIEYAKYFKEEIDENL